MSSARTRILKDGTRAVMATVSRREAASLLKVKPSEIPSAPVHGTQFANASNRWMVYRTDADWRNPREYQLFTHPLKASSAFENMGNEDLPSRVADILTAQGFQAVSEYTGGGFTCVVVTVDGSDVYFGTANSTWNGQPEPDAPEALQNRIDAFETAIPSDSRDAALIASGIAKAIRSVR